MKKTYNIPAIRETHLVMIESLLLDLSGGKADQNGEVLVKEDVTSPSAPSYNVWNDDWSN